MKENEEIHNEPLQSFNKWKQFGNGSSECQSQMNTGLEMWRRSVSIFLLLLQDAINLAQHYCSLRTSLWIVRPASSFIWVNDTLGGYYTMLLHFTVAHQTVGVLSSWRQPAISVQISWGEEFWGTRVVWNLFETGRRLTFFCMGWPSSFQKSLEMCRLHCWSDKTGNWHPPVPMAVSLSCRWHRKKH